MSWSFGPQTQRTLQPLESGDLAACVASHAVAAALGHESFKTTAESYAQRGAVSSTQQKRVLGVLTGGKLAS